MDRIIEPGLAVVEWLQINFSGTVGLMRVISSLGEFDFYLLLVLFFYWCVQKSRAKHLIYVLAVGSVSINIFKHFFQAGRPFWYDQNLLIGETSGYGIPSGHAASAAIAFIYLAGWAKKGWIWFLAFLWIILMGISRMMLGHHFPHDVLAGYLLAAVILAVYWVWLRNMYPAFRERILGQRFWLAILFPLAFAGLFAVLTWLRPLPDIAASMRELAAAAELVSLEDVTASLALLLGLGIGFVLEGRDVRFTADGEWWRRGLRYILGVAVTLGFLYGLRALFASLVPAGDAGWVFFTLRFIRYFIVAMVAVYFMPMFFAVTGLADAEPRPGINTSLNRLFPGRRRDQ